MADKGKRLRKILDKAGLKGQFKQVGSLDEAHIVLITDPKSITQLVVAGKDEYKQALENGETHTEDKMIYFLVSANPRNKWHIERRLLTNKFGMSKNVL